MNYRFDIELGGKAVNEQWHDDARMFMQAANAALDREEHAKWLRYYNAGRLEEYAAVAFRNAAGTTIGHKKSDRYEEQERACRQRSADHYAFAKKLWEAQIASQPDKL